ncbi:hypothetical protein ACS0TY_033251 [Phlomoides rotata]
MRRQTTSALHHASHPWSRSRILIWMERVEAKKLFAFEEVEEEMKMESAKTFLLGEILGTHDVA